MSRTYRKLPIHRPFAEPRTFAYSRALEAWLEEMEENGYSCRPRDTHKPPSAWDDIYVSAFGEAWKHGKNPS